MRNENFWGCAAICLAGCLLDTVSPFADMVTVAVGVSVGA